MERVNGNDILNVSASGGDEDADENEAFLRLHSLEAYTVVLSVTAHLLSTVVGGSSSAAVILTLTTRSNINRRSYALILALLGACCSCNFLWSPLEVADLITFHYRQRHPSAVFTAVKTAIYIFLVLLISFVIALLSLEGILRFRNCFGPLLRRSLSVYSSVSAVLFSLLLTGVFITTCLRTLEDNNASYIITDTHVRSFFLALVATALGLVAFIMTVLLWLFAREAVYWENGRPHFKRKTLKLEIPEFLINQSNACADIGGGFEPGRSASGTPSPTTPQLLVVGDPETVSAKGEDASQIPDLPLAKSMGNRLGINMAQVLGRRRHTICQISDSSGGTSVASSTPMDPISRAKQYNYVRKFSVDISALQAQLQNPKIFRDAPYQSDIDLSAKRPVDSAQAPPTRPLLPLKPLSGHLEEKEDRGAENAQAQLPKPLLPLNPLSGHLEVKTDKGAEKEGNGAESKGVGVNNSPPPVIMVTNDDIAGEGNIPNDDHISKTFHEEAAPPDGHSAGQVQKPTTLHIDEAAEQHTSAPTLDSATTDPSDTEPEGRGMARLTVLLSLACVLAMIPVLVTELLSSRLSRHAFANIATCTMAVSTIQTIVYPHLIVSGDRVVHRVIRQLRGRVHRAMGCGGGSEDGHAQREDSSSPAHV